MNTDIATKSLNQHRAFIPSQVGSGPGKDSLHAVRNARITRGILYTRYLESPKPFLGQFGFKNSQNSTR